MDSDQCRLRSVSDLRNYLLNGTEHQARKWTGVRPLRRSIPVRGINKSIEVRKHTTLAVWREEKGDRKVVSMRVDRSRDSTPVDLFTFYHTPGITATVSAKDLLCKSLVFDSLKHSVLINSCLIDLCHSYCQSIICMAMRSLIVMVRGRRTFTLLNSS